MNMRQLLSGILICVSFAAAPLRAADPPAPAQPAEPRMTRISHAELLERMAARDPGLVVLDVRTPAEFAAGHVPGARNVSHDRIDEQLASLEPLRDKLVVLYCRSGRRSAAAHETLTKAGFSRLRHLEGDFLAWEAEGRPVERPSEPGQQKK